MAGTSIPFSAEAPNLSSREENVPSCNFGRCSKWPCYSASHRPELKRLRTKRRDYMNLKESYKKTEKISSDKLSYLYSMSFMKHH